MKNRRTGQTILVVLEIIALVIIVVLSILKLLKPKQDTRTIQTTEAVTEAMIQTAEASETEATTEATTEETTTEEVAEEPEFSVNVKEQLSNMTLEEKVSLLFVVSPENLTGEERVTIAGEKTRTYLEQYHIGGLSYAYMNYEDETQLKDMLDNTQMMAAELMPYTPLMFARDDETSKLINTTSRNLNALSKTLSSEDGVEIAKKNASINVIPRYPEDETVAEDTAIVRFDPLKQEDIQAYRQENGYYGIIMVDKTGDEAEGGEYTATETVVAAIKAGADMIYEPDNFEEAFAAIVQAVDEGELTQEAIDKAAGRVLTYMDEIGYLSENATGEEHEE